MASIGTLVTAVHAQDTLDLLLRLGVKDAFLAGELTCSVCGDPLNKVGLGAARRKDEQLLFACTRLDCLEQFHTS